MLKPVRIEAGLGNPPPEYTTNDTESANFMVKYGLNFNPKKPHEFIQAIKGIIDQQFNNEDRAVFGRGPYIVKDGFKHLLVKDAKWSTMTIAQRKGSIEKFCNTGIDGKKLDIENVADVTSLLTSTSCTTKEQAKLSLTAEASGIKTIPFSILQTMFDKANVLLAAQDHVVPKPGATGGSFIVAGHSNKIYTVTPGRGGSMSCDRSCTNKTTDLCEHVLAVAERRGQLSELLAWYKRAKKRPRLTGMALQSGPKTAGKKPSKRKRSNSKKVQIDHYVDLLQRDQNDSVDALVATSHMSRSPSVSTSTSTYTGRTTGTVSTRTADQPPITANVAHRNINAIPGVVTQQPVQLPNFLFDLTVPSTLGISRPTPGIGVLGNAQQPHGFAPAFPGMNMFGLVS